MKKTSFIIPALALLLASCGGSTQRNNGGASTDSTGADSAGTDGVHTFSTPTAYQIFKMLDPKNASIKFDDEGTDKKTDTTSKDKFKYSKLDEDSFVGETVQCLDNNAGGRLVVYQHWYEDMDGYYTDDLKLYLCKDGKLSECKDLMPEASIDDFIAADPVSFYKVADGIKNNIAVQQFNKEYDTEESPSMLRYYIWTLSDPKNVYYKWDGSKFAPAKSDKQTTQFNVLSTAGIGKIFLGDNPPESLDGFQVKKDGKKMTFSRDGKPQFRLSLSDDGKIDTIFVLSDRYTYRMDVDGPTNDHYGVGYSDLGYGLFKGQYFTFKDGVWVRVIDEANDSNVRDLFGEYAAYPIDYPHNGVIEFYTTKNAITNINPEPGKQVDDNDNPKFDAKAKVTLIKIYRQQADANKGGKIAEEVFKKMYPDITSIECYDESPMKCSGYPKEECEGCIANEEVACYQLKDGGYFVISKSAFGGPGCSTEYSYGTNKYDNGTIQDTDIKLPLPKLDDLLKPDMVESYKDDIAKFREMFDKEPMGYLCYELMPPNAILVRLHPFDCDGAYFDMDKVMLNNYEGDKIPEYKWDGEKFVKQ